MDFENISSFWPGWNLGELIGQGSYGKVYKAFKQEHSLLSVAAIKVISIPQSKAEIDALRMEGFDEGSTKTYFSGVVDDFINEIKLMESMKGASNIVSVEDFKVVERTDSIGWHIFIRMELLTPLPKYTENRSLPEDEILKIGCDICTALEFCTKQNIIHRDIKPDNIFVSKFGDFKLGDFGIAKKLDKTASTLSAKGTHTYVAPEVVHGEKYDQSVDIYSLGIVLYKLLNNNRYPFISSDASQISYKDRENAVARRLAGEALPPPCNASRELAAIILTACNYDPAKRFKNPTALKKALLNYKNSRSAPFTASPVTPPYQSSFTQSAPKDNDYDKTVAIRQPSGTQNVQSSSYTSAPHTANTYNQQTSNDYDKTVAIKNNNGYTPPPYSAAPQGSYQASPQPYPPYTPAPTPPKKKKSKAPLIILIILLILALVGGGVAVWKLGIFDNSSPSTQAEKNEDKPEKTTEDSTEPETSNNGTDSAEIVIPDTTDSDEPDPPIYVPEDLFISEISGDTFFSSEKFTAEATDIDFDNEAEDFFVNFKFKNNSSETLHFYIDYININTVVSYNPYAVEIEAGETINDYIYIYQDYCAALGIDSMEDLSNIGFYYEILDSNYNSLYSDVCEFITANYDEDLEVNINGRFFVEESDIKAIVYAFTSNYDTDLTVAVKSIGPDYRIHIDEFYINGIEYKFDDDEGYDIIAYSNILMMDNIYLDENDLATIGLTPEEVETVQFSGTVYDENNRRVYDFNSEVFEAREDFPS